MVSGELEVELRWVRSQLTFIPEPLYKLHIGDMSAAILSSESILLDGSARLGVHTAMIKRAPIADKTLVCSNLCILRATSLDPNSVGIGHPFVVVRCNDSEVHRTPAQQELHHHLAR